MSVSRANRWGRVARGLRLLLPAMRDAKDIHEEALRRHVEGDAGRAVELYAEALAIRRSWPEAHNNLGAALSALGRYVEAAAYCQRAIELNPAYRDAWNNLGFALGAVGRCGESLVCYRAALAMRPDYFEAHHNIAIVLAGQGRTAEAVEEYERALALRPADPAAHNSLGVALVELGRICEAHAHYDRAIGIDPDHVQAHFNRAHIGKFHVGDPAVRAPELLINKPRLPARNRMLAHFALGKAFDDTGDYGRAFENWNAASRLKRAQIQYSEDAVHALFRRTMAAFDRGVTTRGARGGSKAAPIFVVGMPRSGSSLIEQILAAHPQVRACGEREDFERALGAVVSTASSAQPYPERAGSFDSPGSQSDCGRVPRIDAHRALRSADRRQEGRQLPSRRSHSHSFSECAHSPYDAQSGGYMRLLRYCNLERDESCLRFQQADRAVQTASAAQVRKPVFQTSVERWRKYEPWLAPLLAELAPCISDENFRTTAD